MQSKEKINALRNASSPNSKKATAKDYEPVQLALKFVGNKQVPMPMQRLEPAKV